MTEVSIPEEYLIEGLEAVHYSKPDDKCEAVAYVTPNGAKFSLAKDFMGIQICMSGRFWPPPFTAFRSMKEGVWLLTEKTAAAIIFFDRAHVEREERRHVRKKGSK